MELTTILTGLIASLTGLVSFVNINTIIEFLKYVQIPDFTLFVVVLTFARVPFEILSFTFLGTFNETTVIATSKNLQNFNVLLKQSILAVFFALLFLPASTFVLPIIWSEIKTYTIILSALLFSFISIKYFKKNWKETTTVILLSSICGIITLHTLSSSGLFPLLTGLYAIPTLLIISEKQEKHLQKTEFNFKISLAGAIAALISGVLPAVGSSLVAILAAGIFTLESFAFQSLVFSIYSARIIFDFANVYTIGKARSMAATLLPYNITYEQMLTLVIIGIACMLLTSGMAYLLSTKLKKININTQITKHVLLILIIIAVAIQTGPFGILAMTTSTIIGIYAAKCENRILLSACLIASALSTLF